MMLHNSFYQKLSVTFIYFYIDNEDDEILTCTKRDLPLHRGFSQTPCHPEKTSGPKKGESAFLQRF